MFSIDVDWAIKFALSVWNSLIQFAYDLLFQSPSTFKGGVIWKAMMAINPYFIIVSTAVLSVLFMAGFVKEFQDLRKEINIEIFTKLLCRLTISEYLIVNTFTIINDIFKIGGALIKNILTAKVNKVSVSKADLKVFQDVSITDGLVLIIVSVICILAISFMGGALLYTVYMRFFKIYVSLPFGSLAVATTAGAGMGYVAKGYVQHILTLALEGVAIAVAIVVCNKFIGSGLDLGLKGSGDMAKGCIILFEKTFAIALTLGVCKGAEVQIRRMFNF